MIPPVQFKPFSVKAPAPFNVPLEKTYELTVVGELRVSVPPDWVNVPNDIALPVSVLLELELITLETV